MKQSRAQRQLNDVLASAQELIVSGRSAEACLTLRHALPLALRLGQVQRVLGVIQSASPETRVAEDWTELQVRAFGGANQPLEVLQIADGLKPLRRARYVAYSAWALVRTHRFADALELTEHLNDAMLEPGLGWRSRMEAMLHLGDADWVTALERARSFLTGVPLGLCLREAGSRVALNGEFATARGLLAEAFSLLQHDPLEATWTKYNQGMVALNLLLPEAETHFLAMQALMRSKAARAFESRAWSGIGASRRAMGEFERAIAAYERAERVARATHDLDDACHAWFELGQTHRLAGNLTAALEAFHTAARTDPKAVNGAGFVDAALAATYAQLGDEATAWTHVERAERASGVTLEHRERLAIVCAELQRRRGDADRALEALRGLTLQALWVREERACFTRLFALLEAMTGTSPAVLERPVRTTVEVRARGLLRVRVNGREVPLAPTGFPGQVLVLLLEAGGASSVDGLLAQLDHRLTPAQRRARAKQLSGYVVALREALGWTASVQSVGGAYRLDEGADWQYDIAQARTNNEPVEHFLDGVYTDWAVELARALQVPERTLN